MSVILKVAASNIHTDAAGYQALVNFYHRALQYRDTSITLDFSSITWFDANMSAILAGMVHKLSQENNLKFYTDGQYIEKKLDVLIRNGFILFGNQPTKDSRKSTLPIQSFSKTDKDGFIEYIDKNLMKHRGMPQGLTPRLQEQIKDDLVELMSNVNYHSNTSYPFFVCGQYYPYLGYLVLTIADLGDGFLPKIQSVTNGDIKDAKESILWALSGKTTKPHQDRVPGGLGIRNIYNYCKENQGKFHIATGNAFWQSELECSSHSGCQILSNSFIGSSINLFFKHS